MTWLYWLFPLVLVVGIWLLFRAFREKPRRSSKRDERRQPQNTSSPPPLILTPTKTQPIELLPSPRPVPVPRPRPINVPLADTPPIETLLAQEQSGQLEKDNWEIHGEVVGEFPVKATLHLHYVDGGGLATERTVEIRKCGQYFDDVMVAGYCRMRNANRTFLVSRIKKCFDEDTGEVVTDVAKYLRDRYEQSPDGALDRWLADEYDVLRVLLYVAKADGFLRKPEKAIIAAYCRELIGDTRITDEMIANVLGGLAVPSVHVFRRIVGQLQSRSPEVHGHIITVVEKIIGTDKNVHPAEQEALDYLQKRWG